jgi:predicted nucleic acid-binding protein
VVTALAYLDASAIVKLVVEEPESHALTRWYVEAERLATSRIGVVEATRACARRPFDAVHRDRVLSDLEVVELDAAIAAVAAALGPATIKSLDAIHLATALALVPDLDAFVTYDDRLAEAARGLGLSVVRPA